MLLPPPASLKRKLRLEALDERAVPDGSNPTPPPDNPPPQTGDPAAQTTQQVFAYVVQDDGQIVFGMVEVPMQGPSSGTTAFNSIYDSNTGTVIAADANFHGQTVVIAPPDSVQANTVYFFNPTTGGWDAVPLTSGQTSLLSPSAGNSVTPLPSADGQGVAWAVHPETTAVPNGTPALAAATVGAAPPTPTPGVPPEFPPGSIGITLPAGTTIQLADGRTMTFPGGVMMVINPIDGGIWFVPTGGQPGVVEDPRIAPGSPGSRTVIPPGGNYPVSPGDLPGGSYTPGGPSGGRDPYELPLFPPRREQPAPTPLWNGFFGGSGTPGRMPPLPLYRRLGPGPGVTPTPAIPAPPVQRGVLRSLLDPTPPQQ